MINFVSKVRGMTISSKLKTRFMGVLLVPQPHTGSKPSSWRKWKARLALMAINSYDDLKRNYEGRYLGDHHEGQLHYEF